MRTPFPLYPPLLEFLFLHRLFSLFSQDFPLPHFLPMSFSHQCYPSFPQHLIKCKTCNESLMLFATFSILIRCTFQNTSLFLYNCIYINTGIYPGFIRYRTSTPSQKQTALKILNFLCYKVPNWFIYIFLIMSVPINKFNIVNNYRVITK